MSDRPERPTADNSARFRGAGPRRRIHRGAGRTRGRARLPGRCAGTKRCGRAGWPTGSSRRADAPAAAPLTGAGLSRAGARSRGSLAARRGPGRERRRSGRLCCPGATGAPASTRRSSSSSTRSSSRSGSWSSRSRRQTAAMPKLEQRVGALEQKPAPPLPDLGEMRQQIAAVSAGVSDLTTRLERLEKSAQSPTAGIAELKTGLEQLGREQQAQTASLAEMTSRLNRAEQTQQAQAITLSDLTGRLDRATGAAGASRRTRGQARSAETGIAGAAIGRGRAGEPFAGFRKDRAIAGRRSDRYGPDTGLAADPQRGRSRAAVSGGIRRLVVAREGEAGNRRRRRAARRRGPDRDRRPRCAGAGTARAGAKDRRGSRRRSTPRAAGPARRSTACAAWSGSAAPTRPSRARRPRRPSRWRSGRSPAAIWRAPSPRSRRCKDRRQLPAAEWLRKARERLAVEAALQRLEALLTARLGDTAAIPGSPG